MTEDIIDLSPVQLDVLREIGNVGAGNSATALSQLINRRIDMNVPKVSVVPLDEVPDLVGGPETIVVGVFLRVYGKAPSNILFLMPKDSAFYLVDALMGKESGETTHLDMMNLSLSPSIPALAMDMAGAILNVVLVQLGQMGDHAMVIETEFLAEDDELRGHFFLVPDPGSMEMILSAVGVG